MAQQAICCINQVACLLKVQPGNITTDEDFLLVRTRDHFVVKGFVNIIMEFLNESQPENIFKNIRNDLEETQVWQWLEYCIVYVIHAKSHQSVHQILRELNEILKLKTYLVSNKVTIADIVLYYVLHGIMLNLNPVEKELYMNVSRWFDNLQQDKSFRQSNEVVNFSSNYISQCTPVGYI